MDNTYIKWAVGITIFLLTHEALQWSWTLSRHANWMQKHSEFLTCRNLNYRMTSIAAVMAGGLSILMGVWFICYRVDAPDRFYIASAIVAGIQLSHIHFLALLARCTELPMELWPLPSKCVAKYMTVHVIKVGSHIKRAGVARKTDRRKP